MRAVADASLLPLNRETGSAGNHVPEAATQIVTADPGGAQERQVTAIFL